MAIRFASAHCASVGRPATQGAVSFRHTEVQERVAQHRSQSGRERDGQARAQTVALPAFEKLEQGDVRFGDGLEEPILFEKPLMLRVAHKGQVRVQDERKVASHWISLKPGSGLGKAKIAKRNQGS